MSLSTYYFVISSFDFKFKSNKIVTYSSLKILGETCFTSLEAFEETCFMELDLC